VLIRELKSSDIIEELQQKFYEQSKNPLSTEQ